MFSCSNLRNKKCNIKVENDSVLLNDESIEVQKAWFLPCSLSRENATVVVKLATPYKKKSELFLDYSWLHHNKSMEDEDRVEEANNTCVSAMENIPYEKVNEKEFFEGRFENTYDMTNIYKCGNFLVAPKAKKLLDLNSLRVVFLERMASYLRNFDITFGFDNAETVSIYTVNRKLFYRGVRSMFTDTSLHEGSPDPLPWPQIKKHMTKDKLGWQQVAQLYIGVEEEDDEDESEWTEESESEGDDDDDLVDLVDEGEESAFEEETSEEEEEEDEEDYESDEQRKRSLSDVTTEERSPKKIKL